MSTTDQEHWWLVEAGEYVLGTLRGTERDLFEKVLERDAEARGYVDYWDTHFQSIDEHWLKQAKLPPVPEHVWTDIKTRIASGSNTLSDSNTTTATHGTTTPSTTDTEIKSRVARTSWTAAAMAASVLLTVLAMRFIVPTLAPTPVVSTADSYNVVSVIPSETGEGLWTVLADTNDGTLRVVGLNTPSEADTWSHQLWIVLPDEEGVQSVGILPYGLGTQRIFNIDDTSLQAGLAKGVAFAVSREPPGGTTEPAPTGPVIASADYSRLN